MQNQEISKIDIKKSSNLQKVIGVEPVLCFRVAIEKVEKGLQYAYRDRRNRKRDFRGLWIQRIKCSGKESMV